MDIVLRAAALYAILLVLFRITGKRTLADTTTFDFILLLIISEATQQALVGEDGSLTAALLVIVTFLILDVALSYVKQYSRVAQDVVDSVPLLIVADGRLLEDRMAHERVGAADILQQARHLHGLERLDQIKYAVLEPSGGISIIPKDDARA